MCSKSLHLPNRPAGRQMRVFSPACPFSRSCLSSHREGGRRGPKYDQNGQSCLQHVIEDFSGRSLDSLSVFISSSVPCRWRRSCAGGGTSGREVLQIITLQLCGHFHRQFGDAEWSKSSAVLMARRERLLLEERWRSHKRTRNWQSVKASQ